MARKTPPKVKLYLSFNNKPRLALSIPLAECGTFAVYPLRWLRFLGFIIYGGEGHLTTSKAGPEIDDYTADIEARAYYFVSEGEHRLVDVGAMDERTSNVSSLTTHRATFRGDAIERDGTCVMTGDLAYNCDACHILPHAKGNDYILNVVQHRGEAYDSDNISNISNINDTRNGLLLFTALHRPFGDGRLAFLKTPNFALSVNDIPYHPPRGADEESPASRLTLQYLLPPGVVNNLVPHNSDARQPQDASEWPPAIIVDLSYASAALNAWSSKRFINFARNISMNIYYHDGDGKDDDNAVESPVGPVGVQMGDQTIGQSGTGRYNLRRRDETSNIPPGQWSRRHLADLTDVVCGLWMRTSRENKLKLEGAHTPELDLARNESIKMWLQSMEGSTS